MKQSERHVEKQGKLTEAGVLREKLGELVAVVLVVAAVGAVAEGGDADLGGAQVVGGHYRACSRGTQQGFTEELGCSKNADLKTAGSA